MSEIDELRLPLTAVVDESLAPQQESTSGLSFPAALFSLVRLADGRRGPRAAPGGGRRVRGGGGGRETAGKGTGRVRGRRAGDPPPPSLARPLASSLSRPLWPIRDLGTPFCAARPVAPPPPPRAPTAPVPPPSSPLLPRSQLNIFIGVGILSLPYGLRESGWFGIGALFSLAVLFCASGLVIVKAFSFLPSHASKTFPALGREAGGRFGESLVTFFILCELLGGTLLQTLVLWSELETVLEALGWPAAAPRAALAALPRSDASPFVTAGLAAWAPADVGGWSGALPVAATLNATAALAGAAALDVSAALAGAAPAGLAARLLPSAATASTAISTSVLMPLVAVGSFEILSYFSAGGAVATASIVGLLIGLPLLDPSRAKLSSAASTVSSASSSLASALRSAAELAPASVPLAPTPAPPPAPLVPPPAHHLLSPGILRAMGLFSMALSGHSTLPALRTAMRRPQSFSTMLVIGFSVMACAYAVAAGTGYWYYGDEVTAVVATDLAQRGVYVEHPGVPVLLAALIASACIGRVASLLLIAQGALLDAIAAARAARGRPPVRPRVAVLRVFRLALYTVVVAVALTARERVGQLAGLLGSFCSLTLGLLVPVSCYLSLAWSSLSTLGRASLGTIAALAAVQVVVGTAQNLQAMFG